MYNLYVVKLFLNVEISVQSSYLALKERIFDLKKMTMADSDGKISATAALNPTKKPKLTEDERKQAIADILSSSKWENGVHKPAHGTFWRVANRFNKHVSSVSRLWNDVLEQIIFICYLIILHECLEFS